ncbi:GIY-YIG nuclease family protein [Klebsiella pneumoniae]|uniref:GIY-YIG nuclease family protein n=1 Tax=Klebsiella pneumoniae TaxID=573 RepID=UPI000E2D9DF6|nr:GIY-YIG nuclease family protein [Klebsiella pneumoniae]HDU4367090.1 GIY-YIG nuclease family protein [Klebsiella pneumoniae subsp. pneumoniae]MBP3133652.1 GIY-YIG nuclease family protein [Klebsiella pneumoniae]MBP3148306.1 GIY-YIG nuclease family protein [Klebsiella pneumoniae]MDF9924274.1 GIY-YIG nuclease family protein [Klebsiella pneumoniae]SWW28684.1 T5orf172 domain [Klebsiella pneumoniae]
MQLDGEWIYVFMSGSDTERFKVGKTKNNPLIRLNNLRTGDPTLDFRVAYFIPSSLNWRLYGLEKHIHDQLEKGFPRISFYNDKRSEWFMGDAIDIWREMDIIFENLEVDVTDYFDPEGTKVVRFWEENLKSIYGPGLPLDDDGFPVF